MMKFLLVLLVSVAPLCAETFQERLDDFNNTPNSTGKQDLDMLALLTAELESSGNTWAFNENRGPTPEEWHGVVRAVHKVMNDFGGNFY
jgi:hypothetical protein